MSVCPECTQGKCRNCDGTAWDLDTDAPTDCRCPNCRTPACVACQSDRLPLNDDGWCRWCVEAERCEKESR